ncbi:transposase [Paeniroseomonas aquatica]|uniref:Transposase n=1 Tax=Paeniroseomonas aquatica TaxID=373043 RepID=A0ABT8A3V2_9PROT|nr:transposase [Paeniroseomonas aquatica]MDN3564379.1 transposase [Paeniroseomonas aquatica]
MAVAKAHPEAEVQLWCQDEARVGQKGRGARVWFERGVRSEGVIDHRYASAWLYGAVRPGTDEAFALVMTEVGAAAMQAFLNRFAATLPNGVHAALMLDGAGWHTAGAIVVPDNVSLVLRLDSRSCASCQRWTASSTGGIARNYRRRPSAGRMESRRRSADLVRIVKDEHLGIWQGMVWVAERTHNEWSS